MDHRIAEVETFAGEVPLRIAAGPVEVETSLSGVVALVTTEEGLTGHGFTAITDEEVVAAALDALVAPHLRGLCALDRERIAERLYWLMTPCGQTGYASHAASAIDLALWDILGKATGLPCWRLLGGARGEVPLYTTFGFGAFDRDQLGDAARHLSAEGVTRFKMVVGHHALRKRNEGADLARILAEDVARVAAVREAIGSEAELFIDANCSLDPFSARWLAERVAGMGITFFEEPLRDNAPDRMAELRRIVGLPIAAGQNEGQLWRFEALMAACAVDVVQPNAVICGGFTVAAKVAGLAAAKNVAMVNGGAFPFQNMHLMGGVANGGLVEWHLGAVEMCRSLFNGLPEPTGETLRLPDRPGLGFEPDLDALEEMRARPSSAGGGKG